MTKMLKIADSAAIKHHMPTRPRSSGASGISDCGSVTVVAAIGVPLLVLPIRIFGMFQVPQWATATHYGNLRKVIFGRRRRCTPLQRPCIPGVVARWLTSIKRPHRIHHPAQNSGKLEDDADGDN